MRIKLESSTVSLVNTYRYILYKMSPKKLGNYVGYGGT